MADPDPAVFGARRGGRALWCRQNIEAAALLGEHVHALARDGQWCVTSQPAGFLWARIRRRARTERIQARGVAGSR